MNFFEDEHTCLWHSYSAAKSFTTNIHVQAAYQFATSTSKRHGNAKRMGFGTVQISLQKASDTTSKRNQIYTTAISLVMPTSLPDHGWASHRSHWLPRIRQAANAARPMFSEGPLTDGRTTCLLNPGAYHQWRTRRIVRSRNQPHYRGFWIRPPMQRQDMARLWRESQHKARGPLCVTE